MDLKPIIVREYLESLTENEELDALFPILLESKGFTILSKPTEYKGFPQYGKDVIAVGKDFEDGQIKRFYFEIKGGQDRHVTTQTYKKNDGIRESILEAKDKDFNSSYPNFDSLLLKIVLVHNGEIKANIQGTFDDFISKEFPENSIMKFERWGISELTKLFSEHLFGAYLLTDQRTTKLFNRVLVNLNVNDGIQAEFIELIDVLLFEKEEWHKNYEKKLPRKWKVLFESLKLISFIIHTESKEYNNLDIAKRYLTHLLIRFWYWILKNKLERKDKVIFYFNQIFVFYRDSMMEYYERTLPIAMIKDGLHSEKSGRYEQIGYTVRTFEYLQHLCFLFNTDKFVFNEKFDSASTTETIKKILSANSVSARPLIDVHSIPIMDTLNFLIESGELEDAKEYLREVLAYLQMRKSNHDILPDANNSIENVIKYSVNGFKPVFYSDSTSPILTVLMEYTVILEAEESYYLMRDFIIEKDIDLGVFVPHHGINSTSKHLIEDRENDLDEQLFSRSVNDGYQSELILINRDLKNEPLTFPEFKEKIKARKNEFEYKYRTAEAGYSFLIDLAHIYFKTPYFPDKWRDLIK
ncbi:MAG: hypothetical protein RL308_27 [Bacteroidota bacterium]|jgi:hypothetical protein